MTVTIALAGLAMLAVVGGLIGLPLLGNRRRPLSDGLEATTIEGLQEQLDRIISAVHDLDFDFDTGKVSEVDYIDHRKLLIGRGVSALIQLDESLEERDDLDQKIEKLVTAYRRQGA